jgi:hypothetical protein
VNVSLLIFFHIDRNQVYIFGGSPFISKSPEFEMYKPVSPEVSTELTAGESGENSYESCDYEVLIPDLDRLNNVVEYRSAVFTVSK